MRIPEERCSPVAFPNHIQIGGNATEPPFFLEVIDGSHYPLGRVCGGGAVGAFGMGVNEFDIGDRPTAPAEKASLQAEIHGLATKHFFIESADVFVDLAPAAVETSHDMIDFEGPSDLIARQAEADMVITVGMQEEIAHGVNAKSDPQLLRPDDAEIWGSVFECLINSADPVRGQADGVAVEADEDFANCFTV